jgi:hypothetical protein
MPQAKNAGIKRNRQRTGGTVVERKIRLAPDTEAAFKAAAQASGNLSMSLYLERLARQLRAEQGNLPVLSPTLDGAEVSSTAAA